MYVPPHKLRALASSLPTSPSDAAYQQRHWELLKRSLHGLVNRVNASNLASLLPAFFSENLIRGRGLLVRSLMKAQLSSPSHTAVYAALANVINSKLPEVGLLLVHRLVLTFRRSFTRNEKVGMEASVLFLSHLLNQGLLGELTLLEVLTLLLETPSDDSCEVACDVVTHCGAALSEAAPQATHGVFERIRHVLHEGSVSRRVQYRMEALFEVRRSKWEGWQRVAPELDLVEEADVIVHEVSLDDDDVDMQAALNAFHYDDHWEQNEAEYAQIKNDILGEPDEPSAADADAPIDPSSSSRDEPVVVAVKDDGPPSASAAGGGGGGGGAYELTDLTETDVINLRRTIYLTIMSSLSHEETAHKLMRMSLTAVQQPEVINMILECCSMEKTYLPFYGSLLERFAHIRPPRAAASSATPYRELIEEAFVKHYAMIHRFETNRLRNLGRIFAHVLSVDAVSWTVLGYVRLTEEDTTSAGRIFVKVLMQEVVKVLGMERMKERMHRYWLGEREEDREVVSGLMPRDSAKNLRFSINYFTSIGLGGLTEDMREELVVISARSTQLQQQQPAQVKLELSSSESDSDSDSDSDSSSGSSTSSSSGRSSSGSDSSGSRRRSRRHTQRRSPPPPCESAQIR